MQLLQGCSGWLARGTCTSPTREVDEREVRHERLALAVVRQRHTRQHVRLVLSLDEALGRGAARHAASPVPYTQLLVAQAVDLQRPGREGGGRKVGGQQPG